MAVSDYAIPWSPPDLTPGLSLLARSLQARRANKRAEENTKIQRMFADAQLRRMDQESARHVAEFNARENEKMRKAEMEKAAFMERIPYLTRNPMLPAIAAQYGIQGQMVDEPAQQTAAPTTNPVLAAAMQPGAGVDAVPTGDAPLAYPDAGVDAISGGGGPEPVAQDHTTVAPMAPTGFEGGGLDALTDEQRRIMAENVTSVGDRTTLASEIPADRIVKIDEAAAREALGSLDEPITADVPPAPPAQAPIAAAPPVQAPPPVAPAQAPAAPRNKLFRAVIGGQQYDVGGQSPSTGLGEKYDALYSRYLQEPGGEKVAFAKTLAAWQAEQTSIAAGERAKEAAGSREQMAGQKEEFTRWLWENFHLTAEQLLEQRKLDRTSRERSARDASGQAPVPPALAQIITDYESGKLQGRGEVLGAAAEKRLPAKMVSSELGGVTRDAAAAERAGEKRAGLEMNDLNGNFFGYAHNTTQANKMKTQTDQMAQALKRLNHAIEDIEANGPRVIALSPSEFADEWQKRLSNLESVNAAMRVYNGLGATDASQRLEARITGALGAPGHGWFMGANLDVLKNIRHELEAQHMVRMNTSKRTGPSADRQLAPVLGGQPRQGEGAPAADVKWIRIPARLANDPNFRGKREVSVDPAGNITGSR